MDKLKLDLLAISRSKDAGTPAQHELAIDQFLTALQRHLTPHAISKYTAACLRPLFETWIQLHFDDDKESSASELIGLYFWPLSCRRDAASRPWESGNIVSLFKARP